MKSIGVGIIGLGIIGERLIKVFNQHPDLEIKCGYDIDRERSKYIKKSFNIKTTENWEDIISDSSVDLIYIAVPPNFHYEIAMEVIESGKSIFCEKPLAGSIEEARKMYEAVEKNNIINGMNFPVYYFTAFNNIKNILDTGRLGSVKRVELKGIFPQWPREWQKNIWIDSRSQGGFTREVFTHFIQVIQSLFGEITGIQSNVTYPDDPDKSETALLATGRLERNINVLFHGLTGINQEEELTLKIYGSNGVLELENWSKLWHITQDNGRVELPNEPINPTYTLLDSFVKALNGKEHTLVSFREGYLATKVVEKLLMV